MYTKALTPKLPLFELVGFFLVFFFGFFLRACTKALTPKLPLFELVGFFFFGFFFGGGGGVFEGIH